MDIRIVEREAFTEAWITVRADRESQDSKRLLRDLASTLAAGGFEPVQEKHYGAADAREAHAAARHAAFLEAGLDPSLPWTYHEGGPVRSGTFSGLQVWAVRPHEGARLSTVEAAGVRGRCLEGPGFRLALLPGVRGVLPDGQLAHGVTAQAEQTFVNGEAALQALDMRFGQAIRTWIYLGRILDWYGEFNHVRTPFFRAHDVGAGGRFPASTGIGGRSADEAISMDILALDAPSGGEAAAAPVLVSGRQERAFDYGSAFSRAMSLDLGGRRTIFISGTASIDPSGDTIHLGSADAQVLQTLMSIAALLEPEGASLADIQLATLFCKTPEVLDAFEDCTRLLGIPSFPVVPMIADVCRPELLVEIEAVAVVPRREGSA